MGNPMTMKSVRALEKIKIIKNAITNESLTTAELIIFTGMDGKSVRNYISHLRLNNEVYVQFLQKKGKTYAPCYRLGNKPDVSDCSLPLNMRPAKDSARNPNWVPKCDWAASWIPVRSRVEKAQEIQA